MGLKTNSNTSNQEDLQSNATCSEITYTRLYNKVLKQFTESVQFINKANDTLQMGKTVDLQVCCTIPGTVIHVSVAANFSTTTYTWACPRLS